MFYKFSIVFLRKSPTCVLLRSESCPETYSNTASRRLFASHIMLCIFLYASNYISLSQPRLLLQAQERSVYNLWRLVILFLSAFWCVHENEGVNMDMSGGSSLRVWGDQCLELASQEEFWFFQYQKQLPPNSHFSSNFN